MTLTTDKKIFTVTFNSGLSFEDTISVNIEATSPEEALRIALEQNKDYCSWNNFTNDI